MSAWQILVSEFMLQQTPVARVLPIWLDWVARWPTPSATAAASAGRRAAGLGQAGLPAPGQTPARVRHRHRARSRRRGSRRRRDPADAARRRQLHRPRGGVLRLPAAGAGGGHQRAPGGGAGGARPGRRRARRPRSRDHADVSALLPDDANGAAVLGGADGTRARRCAPRARRGAGCARWAGARGGTPVFRPRRARPAACRRYAGNRPSGSRAADWMCCAATTLRSPAPSWTWHG